MLCIPGDPESRTERVTTKSKKQAGVALKHDENERRGSSDSSSSVSTTETKRSNWVLNVLKAFKIKHLETIKDVALVGVDVVNISANKSPRQTDQVTARDSRIRPHCHRCRHLL